VSDKDLENPFDFVQKAVIKHNHFSASRSELKEIADDFRTLSGSMAVIFNEVSSNEDFTTTRAISGMDGHWNKISKILGFPLLRTSYNLDPKIAEAFKQEGLVKYDSLFDLSRYQIPENICTALSNIFKTGEVFVIGLKFDSKLLGDLVFIQKKGEAIQNRELLELFGQHIALLLENFNRCRSSFFSMMTDRVESEQKGLEIIKSFYKATEQIPDIVYQLDEEGIITFINHAVKRYGYPKEDLIGRSILEIIHKDDRERAQWRLRERRTGNRKTCKFEVRINTKKNVPLYFDVTEKTTPVEPVIQLYAEGIYSGGPGEKFIGTLGVCRDITEERSLETRLNSQTEAFRILAENTDDAIWLEQLDPPGLNYANPGARAIFGDTDDSRAFIESIHHEDRMRVEEFIDHLASSPVSSEIEYRITDKNNEIRWIHSRLYPVFHDERFTGKTVGIASDITKQKLRQEKLAEKLEKEKAYVKEISHRVKNNLALIENMLFLEAENLPDSQTSGRDMLLDIRGRIQSIGLIHGMLYEMSEKGKIDISEYLRRLGEAIFQSSASSENRIQLEFGLEEGYTLPMRDVVSIGMITNELITNALKYAFPGDSRGIITVAFSPAPDNQYVLSISDNGIEMEEISKSDSSGIGMQLVEVFTAQLKGRYYSETIDKTKYFRIRFPKSGEERN
jgi:PAS domain S-box-containing protein